MFGDIINETINTLSVNGNEVAILGNIGIIGTISIPGMVHLEAIISYRKWWVNCSKKWNHDCFL